MEALKHLAIRPILFIATAWLLLGAGNAYAFTVQIQSVSPQAPVPGDTVSFQATAQSTSQLSWYWNFDYEANHNAFTKLSPSVTHAYPKRGSFTVVVYAVDNKDSNKSGFSARK